MSAYNVPFHWRRYQERYNLLGSVCETCGRTYFPLKKICPTCRRDGKIIPKTLSGKGRVHSFTVIRIPPEGFEAFTPYVVGLVELIEGPKVTSQIVDCDPDEVYIGMDVESCFRKLRVQGKDGIICYGFKFRPLSRKNT
jgi:uncharacterized OB-fold protein